MRPYFAIFKVRILSSLQYRAAALAGMGTQIFWGIIKTMILQAFYAQGGVQPITLTQAITFIWIGQALFRFLPWTIDKETEEQVKSGAIAYELVRPMHLYNLWFFRSMALLVVPTCMRGVPMFVLACLFFGLPAPVSLDASLAFSLSLVFAALISASMTTMVIISLFWTVSGEGILRMLPSVVLLLSGLSIPLPLYPEWMQPFLTLQPFRALLDVPIQIYAGVIPSDQYLYYFGFQLVWFVFFVLSGKALLQVAMKRLVIQGG
jgi:ABC-2 type transport system permease protein